MVPQARDLTGLEPFDEVIGNNDGGRGLAVGGVYVLGGAPGTSKSTLVNQICASSGLRVLYATGEETLSQAAERVERIGAHSMKVLAIRETQIEVIFRQARRTKAQLLVIDSIQTAMCNTAKGVAGSPGQVKGCCKHLVDFAKDNGVTTIIIGHVTGDDALAGPRTLSHLVDVVLMLEAGQRFGGNERVLRVDGKNRFGVTNVVGRFELTSRGLIPIPKHVLRDYEDDQEVS